MQTPQEENARGTIRLRAVQAALLVALNGWHAAAIGQDTAEPLPDPPSGNDIVVTGERAYSDKALEQAVSEIAMKGRIAYQPLPRYNAPLCVHVAGPPPATAQAIKARIDYHARTLGLPLGEPGCKVNALIAAVAQPAAFIAGYRKRNPSAFAVAADQAIRRGLQRREPAIVWFDTLAMAGEAARVGKDGRPLLRPDVPQWGPGEVPVNPVVGSGDTGHTVLRVPVTASRINGTLVLDAARLRGFSSQQVADYAAMRLLGDTRPTVRLSDKQASSILSLFETGSAAAPPGLTLLDQAYLHGIYRLKPYAHAGELERSARIAYRALLSSDCSDGLSCDAERLLSADAP